MRGPIGNTAPEHLAPDNCSSQRSCDRPVPAREPPATPGQRPKPRIIPRAAAQERDDVTQVLLGVNRWWRSREVRRWLPGITTAIAEYLDAGLPPAAAIRAIDDFVDLDEHGGRHVPAMRAALRALSADIRLGLACRACGRAHDVLEGLCGLCRPSEVPDGPEDEQLPLQTRLEVYRALGMLPEAVRELDPEAAEAFDPEPPAAPRSDDGPLRRAAPLALRPRRARRVRNRHLSARPRGFLEFVRRPGSPMLRRRARGPPAGRVRYDVGWILSG
jgi:hypothetical protein